MLVYVSIWDIFGYGNKYLITCYTRCLVASKMMHTTNIITILKTQENNLNIKIKQMKKKKTTDELATLEVFSMKVGNAILKNVCNALWMTHLFKTSILVTKTPLTTLKSIAKAVINKLPNSIKQLYV